MVDVFPTIVDDTAGSIGSDGSDDDSPVGASFQAARCSSVVPPLPIRDLEAAQELALEQLVERGHDEARVREALLLADGDTTVAEQVLQQWQRVPPPCADGPERPLADDAEHTLQESPSLRSLWPASSTSRTAAALDEVMTSAAIAANAVDESFSETAAELAAKAAGMRDKATDVAEKAASWLIDSLHHASTGVLPLDRDLSKTHGRDSYEDFYGYNELELTPQASPGLATREPSRRSNIAGVHLPDQDLTLKDADIVEAGDDQISVDLESDAEKSWGLLRRVSELFPPLAVETEAEAVERELQKVRRQESTRTGEITALLARGWMSPESVRRLKEELREMQAKTSGLRESRGPSFCMPGRPQLAVARSSYIGGVCPISSSRTPVIRAQSWHGMGDIGSPFLPPLPPRLGQAKSTCAARLPSTPEVAETTEGRNLFPFPSITPAEPARKTTLEEPSASAKSSPLVEEQKATAKEPAPADEALQQEKQQQDAPPPAFTTESAKPPGAPSSKGKGMGKRKAKGPGGKGPLAPPAEEEEAKCAPPAAKGSGKGAKGDSKGAKGDGTGAPEGQGGLPKAEAKGVLPAAKGTGKGTKGDPTGATGVGKGAPAGPGGPPKAGGKGGPSGKGKAGPKAQGKAKAKAELPKGKPIGRRFEWKMLTSDKVEGTVFANLSAKVSVDVKNLRALFEMPKEQEAKAKSSAGPPKPVQVEVLAHSRAQNVMIALRKQPLTPAVVKALEEVDFEADVLTPEAIEILIGAVPTPEEAKTMVSHRPEVLRGVERTILPLARMERPVAGQRLRVMLFNKMMKELSKDAQTGLGLLQGALEDARSSPAFRTVLCHTMRLGSVINFGNAPKPEAGEGSGDADLTPVGGFCLDALPRLALFRAPGNARITLLHVLVAQVAVEDEGLHAKLQEEIGKVHKAAKRSLASLAEDIGAFNREAEFFASCAASAGGASPSDTVVAKLVTFSEQATAQAAALVQQLADARAASKATLVFFAMQARPAEVDAKALELCVLLSEFLLAFEKARKEITRHPDLAVMCHGGVAEVVAKSVHDTPAAPRQTVKERAATAPGMITKPAATETPAAAITRVQPTAVVSAKAGETATSTVASSAVVVPTMEVMPSSKDSAAADREAIQAANSASAPAVAAVPAAEVPPANVPATTAASSAGEALSVEAANSASAPAVAVAPAAEAPFANVTAATADSTARDAQSSEEDSPQKRASQGASMESFNTLTTQDSPRAMQRTDSFMALITDEFGAAAAASALDLKANTA